MIIVSGNIVVNADDRFEGDTIIGCHVTCLFEVESRVKNPTGTFDIISIDDMYSLDFLAVFKGCNLEGCIFVGSNDKSKGIET